MNLNKTILLFLSISILYSCADYNTNGRIQKKEKYYYSSNGFALIYEEKFYNEKVVNKKMNNEDLSVMHSFLKPNTLIKIINPENSLVIDTKIYKRANYPKIFNAVISKKIASILKLDTNNPYVEIIEVKKNKTFIAKESNTFEEEKNVAEKAPVNKIKMDDLTKQQIETEDKLDKKNIFILVIADFYYKDSAYNLKNTLIEKTLEHNISVKKINNNKYRLFAGPFENFNALKTTYISLNNLGFENLNIYRE